VESSFLAKTILGQNKIWGFGKAREKSRFGSIVKDSVVILKFNLRHCEVKQLSGLKKYYLI
jgi:hypothetical protein